MRTSEYLRAARALIEDPQRWTRHDLATDPGGSPVGPDDITAAKWCALGAIAHVYGERYSAGLPARDALERVNEAVARVNDEEGHTAVLALYDRAIANAEAVEQEFSPSACEPVTFDAMPIDLVRKALADEAFTDEEHAAWVRAWEGI